jgi:purine-nucleoside/S-methyl-5'-thioadenosine phosphorylase / adenosine deaminase
MTLLHWNQAPSAYRVAFSTRVGGVSEGPFRSLNLGLLTGDDAASVVENRRRVCEAVGADPETATMAFQVHGARVTEAKPVGVVTPGTTYEACDGLWTDRPGQGMMLVTADCLPVALARVDGPARLAVLHVGWRGLLAGIVEAGAAALGAGGIVAAIGPGIGPCCYEVGEEVAEPLRARFGGDVAHDGTADLPLAAERALRAAGCATVEATRLCTACHQDRFFAHRRDRGVTGRQGVVGLIA